MKKLIAICSIILSFTIVGCSGKPSITIEEDGNVISGKDKKGNIIKFRKDISIELTGTIFKDPLNATALYKATYPMATTCITINSNDTKPRFPDEQKIATAEIMLRNNTYYLIFTDRKSLEEPVKNLKDKDKIHITGFELKHYKIVKPNGLTININDYKGKIGSRSLAKFLYVTRLSVNGKTYY